MESAVRCKMRVTEVVHSLDSKGDVEQERVQLTAVYGQGDIENATWAKYTPSAHFEISINNPAAMNKLSKGGEFYVDFTPVRPAKSKDVEPNDK